MADVAGHEHADRIRVGVAPGRRLQVGGVVVADAYAAPIHPALVCRHGGEADGLGEGRIVEIGADAVGDIVVGAAAVDSGGVDGLQPNTMAGIGGGLAVLDDVAGRGRIGREKSEAIAERGVLCVGEHAIAKGRSKA